MKVIDVSELIEKAIDQLGSFKLKPSTITAYELRSFNPVKVFFGEREEMLYSTDLSAGFLITTRSQFELRQISAETKRFREKGVFILNELYLTGGLVWRMRPAGKSSVPVCHTEVFASFSKEMEHRGRVNNAVNSIGVNI